MGPDREVVRQVHRPVHPLIGVVDLADYSMNSAEWTWQLRCWLTSCDMLSVNSPPLRHERRTCARWPSPWPCITPAPPGATATRRRRSVRRVRDRSHDEEFFSRTSPWFPSLRCTIARA
jgi:hypothetical protein